MGKVWVAHHKGLETDVVVKFLAPTEAAGREEAESRFAREAAAAAAVKSPHVVQVFDHGTTDGGMRYIVMELLEGRDLAAHLAATGPMPVADVAALVAQVAKALSKAHQVGVIHRDIKPENVFLCDGDGDGDGDRGEMFVKVLDFGIAKREEQTTSKTTTGQVVGTPFYMSPEQIFGERPIDARTDIWALGVVAFEALTGRRPYDGPTIGSLALAIDRSRPRPSAIVPGVPPQIDEWFARACARAPDDRFPSAREAGQAILSAVGATASPAAFRAPAMSLVEASEPQLRAATVNVRSDSDQDAKTSLSTSFVTEAPRRSRTQLVVVGALGLVGLIGVVVAFTAFSRPAPAVHAASGQTDSAPTVSVSVAAPNLTRSAQPAENPPPLTSEPLSPPSTSFITPSVATHPSAIATPKSPVRPQAAPNRPGRRPNDDDIK